MRHHFSGMIHVSTKERHLLCLSIHLNQKLQFGKPNVFIITKDKNVPQENFWER